MATVTQQDDDALLPSFGYKQQFVRSLRHFESFAVAFSFISITTGIFTTYGFAITTAGPRSIWTWLIAAGGQLLVALVYGSLATRVPLSGYSYQWGSRLANAGVGWWLGWMSFAFLTIVTVSVDYGFVQVAFQPLIGQAYSASSAALETLVILAVQAALIIWSTRITTRVNNVAVATEVIGMLGLTVLLIIVAAIRGLGHWSNLGSSGVVPSSGYYAWLGPFMLATLLGAYTIVGFESASNLAEETHEPHRTIPRAMVRAVLLSGAVGMAFLIALSYATSSVKAASASSAPVAFIVNDVLGGVVQKLFLILRLHLDLRLRDGDHGDEQPADLVHGPGPAAARAPALEPGARGRPAARPGRRVLAAVLGGLITLVLRTHTSALVTLFTASTIMPALLYASTVLLYVFAGPQARRGEEGHFSLGRWEIPVIAGALIWLAYELIVLIGPGEFRDAQYYVLGALGLGLVFYIVQWVTEPAAMRTEPGAHGAELPLSRCTSSRSTKAPPRPRPPRRARAAGARERRGAGPGAGGGPRRRGGRPGGAVRVGDRGRRAGAGRGRGARGRGRAGQPGRDRARLGPADRPAADPGDRLAGPAVGRGVPAAGRVGGPAGRHHRPAARPVLRGAEDDLAAGEPRARRRGHHHRYLAAGPPRRGVRHRRGHRVPDAAARPGPDRMVGGGVRGVRPGPRRAAAGRRLRRDRGRDHGVRARAAGGRAGGRPAGGAARRALLRRGPGQVHVRDRRVPAGDRGDPAPCAPAAACPPRWPGGWPGRPATAWTGRSTPRAPRSAGWARSACWPTPRSWTRPAARCPTAAA